VIEGDVPTSENSMDLLSWSELALWILIGVIPVLAAVVVWAAIAEAREESSYTHITEADLDLFRSWVSSGRD
jgi:ACR3 family arsenite efflux pump ArsB